MNAEAEVQGGARWSGLAAWAGAAGWGLACAVLWHGASRLVLRSSDTAHVTLAFYIAPVAAAMIAARLLPLVNGSMVLLAVASCIGVAIALVTFLQRGHGDMGETAGLALLLGTPLLVLRLLLDLFGPRWSPARRRLVALVLAPLALVGLVELLQHTLNQPKRLTESDLRVIATTCLLGLAVIPPLALERRRVG